MKLRTILVVAVGALLLGYLLAAFVGGPLQAWFDRWTP